MCRREGADKVPAKQGLFPVSGSGRDADSEGIPARLGEHITRELDIPTIGISAGPDCDGQVPVIHYMPHLFLDSTPRFAKVYADGGASTRDALERFCEEDRVGRFPAKKTL